MTKKEGIWICVTGIDGVGKTSLCKYLTKLLGKKAQFMKIPYFDWVRDMIQISGNNQPNKDKHTDMLIFSAGNRLEMYLINDYLKKYNFLITQRCWLDNFPYRKVQGIPLKESLYFLKPNKFRKPDIILFLKCNYMAAYKRIKNQNGDKYEELKFMKQLEKEFEKMFAQIKSNKFPIKFSKTKIITIDASKSLAEIKKEAKNKLENVSIYCSGP